MNSNYPYFIDSDRAISMTSKFHITSEHLNLKIESLFPVYPNETVVSHTDVANYLKCQFCVPEKIVMNINNQNLKLSHISEFVNQFNSHNGINIFIWNNVSLIYIMQIADPVFINIIKFDTPEDLLFHIVQIIQSIGLENENQNIQLFGNVTEESQISRLLRIYFSNVKSIRGFTFSNS